MMINIASKTSIHFLFLVSAVILSNCKSAVDENPMTPNLGEKTENKLISPSNFPKKLVLDTPADIKPSPLSTTHIKTFISIGQISGMLGNLKTRYNDKEWIKHDIEGSKIHYNSKVLGEDKTLSGLVVLPSSKGANAYDLKKPLPIFLVCHGTQFVKEKVPSNFKIDASGLLPIIGNITGFEIAATAGAMLVFPDYAGLGINKDIFHPYFIKDPSGENAVDAVYAAVELAIQKGYTVSNDLYIAGYSEGGYVSLASTEYIEKNTVNRFNVVEVYSGAGAYLPHEMWETVLGIPDYSSYAFILYVGKSYSTFGLYPTFDDLVIPSIITKMDDLLDGVKTTSQVNEGITDIMGVDKKFKDMFLPSVVENVQSHGLYDKLKENSFVKSSFQSDIIFYHSSEDTVIPIKNTESTIRRIEENNSTGKMTQVKLNGDHVPAYSQMLGKVMEKFVTHIDED